MTTTTDTIRIFCHNKDNPGEHYATDLERDWKVEEIVAGLIAEDFLSATGPGEVWLVHHARTGTELRGGMTLEAASVEDGDQLTFHRHSHGA